METLKKNLTAIAAAGSLFVIGSFMSRHAVADSSKDVVIANVPLPVSGTVAATQSGAWNVGILGSPNVTVANPAGNPVQVRDVNEASQPVAAANGLAFFESAAQVDIPLYTVPPGKRLVIEYFSGECFMPTGRTAVASVRYLGAGRLLQHWLTMSPPATSGSALPFTSFGGPLRAYVDPGVPVEAIVVTDGAITDSGSGCNATISGHLVSVP